MITEQERADFEAWYQRHHGDRDVYDRDIYGEYVDKQVQGAFNAWQARAALQSQPTEAFPCRIIEADFETGTVTLEMQGKYTVSAGQKYLCDAPLQSQDREDAERYRWLRLQRSITDHACVTWNIGHDWVQMDGAELDAAIDHARRSEGENHGSV